MDFSEAFQRISQSVVNVLAMTSHTQAVASGTGTIFGDGTRVLTCAHCLKPGTTPVARFSDTARCIPATIEYQNHNADIAILKFGTSVGTPALLRSSSLAIGSEAFVVGFPLGITRLTFLSAHIAGYESEGGFELIRIDSSVNHGNSGGPLCNTSGELVGVVNAKHGNLSKFLAQVENAQPGAFEFIGGIDPVHTLQQLIREMRQNLNLGIGYAIPIDHIAKLTPLVSSAIKK